MNLRYKAFIYSPEDGYDIKCPNIAFYEYWYYSSPRGVYKGKVFGLCFWKSLKSITSVLGIKIEYRR